MKENSFLGFHSISDFFESLLGFKDYTVHTIVAIIAMLTSIITGYVWDDAAAIWTLWVLMIADWSTGIIKSFKNKEFVSYKLFRMPLYFIATSFLMAISWNISKGSKLFFLLPGLVLGGFYSVYFLSLIENLGELGLLPKKLVNVLRAKFGLKVLVDKYFKDEESKAGSDIKEE